VYGNSSFFTITILLIIAKAVLIALFFKLIFNIFIIIGSFLRIILLLLGLGSMLVGCFWSIEESDLKKFLTATSINQTGFLFLGISVLTLDSLQACLLHLFLYFFTGFLVFLCIFDLFSTLEQKQIH